MYLMITREPGVGYDIEVLKDDVAVEKWFDWQEDPEELKTEAQLKFADDFKLLDERECLLFRGEIVKPKAVELVKRWEW